MTRTSQNDQLQIHIVFNVFGLVVPFFLTKSHWPLKESLVDMIPQKIVRGHKKGLQSFTWCPQNQKYRSQT